MKAFSTAFTRGLPHGILAAIHLPNPSDEIPEAILQRLHVDERSHAAELNGKRRVEWVGGRIAARTAARAIGFDLPALLPDNYGAPKAPKSLSISIAHKDGMAIALVARNKHGVIGVDLEHLDRDRSHIASKVLNETEQNEIEAIPANRQWTAILLRFAIKEAIYKALAPKLQRYIGFHEAEVSDLANGSARVQLRLNGGLTPETIDAKYEWIPNGIVATVRVRWE